MKYLLVLLALPLFAVTKITVCSSGCDYTLVQDAIDAIPDPRTDTVVIELTAGQTFSENIELKNQTTAGHPVIIRSSGTSSLTPNARVVPTTDSVYLAKISSPTSSPVISVEQGASYYKFSGIEITWTSGSLGYYLVVLGTQLNWSPGWTDNQRSVLSHHIEFDQCWFHGINSATNDNFTSCIAADAGEFHLENSVLSDCYNRGSKEAHAVQVYNGTGPFYIRNNQITASQIGTLVGGSDPSIRGLIPTGIFITGNYYYRPWLWRVSTATTNPSGTCRYDANGGESLNQTSTGHWWLCTSGTWIDQGSGVSPQSATYVKNHFEIKNGWNAVGEGNWITNNWYPTMQSQRGACFLFNQVDNYPSAGTNSPWAQISYVKLENNWCENSPTFLSQGRLGTYYYFSRNLIIQNNIVSKLGDADIVSGFTVGWPSAMTQTHIYLGREVVSHNTLTFSTTGTTEVINPNEGAGDEQVWVDNILDFGTNGFYDQIDGNGYYGGSIAYDWPLNYRSMSKNLIINSKNCQSYSTDCAKQNFWELLNFATTQDKACTSCSVETSYTAAGVNDFTNNDYSLSGTSAYLNWGHYSLNPGADTQVVSWSTQGAISGVSNPYLDFRIRALLIGTTTADYTYTAPSTGSCTLTIAGNPNYSTPVYNTADSGGNPDRSVSVTGLSTKTRYWWKNVCGSYRRSGVFLTR